MAVQLNDVTAIINATANLVQGSSDYCCCFWYQPLGQSTAPDYLAPLALINAGYTAWTGVFTDPTVSTGAHIINTSNGVSEVSTMGSLITTNQIAHIGYRRFGTTHQFLHNGYIVGTATLNIAAVTFVNMLLGNDGSGVVPFGLRFWDFKEWTTSKSVGTIRTEMATYGAVADSLNLRRFTPLATDLLDDSGNGNDWSGAGNFEFVANPSLPQNVSPATAISVSSLPYTDSIPETYNLPLWYLRVPVADESYLGAFGFGGLGTYTPIALAWTNGGTVEWPDPAFQAIGINVPIEYPVIPGQNFYTEFRSQWEAAYGNALAVSFEPEPTEDAPAGQTFLVTDDSFGYGASLISSIDGHVYRFIYTGIPSSNLGENLFLGDGRIVIVAAFPDLGDTPEVKIYDQNLNLLLAVDTGEPDKVNDISSNLVDTVYFGFGIVAPDVAYVIRMSGQGIIDPTVIGPLTGPALAFIAPTLDDTILYFGLEGPNEPVQAWDIASNTTLPNLTGVYDGISHGARCLPDGSLMFNGTLGGVGALRRVAPDGTLIWENTEYDGSGIDYHAIHLVPANDWPDAVWLIYHVSNRVSRFSRIDTATGATLETFDHVTFFTGAYEDAETATPSADFGPAPSCAIVLLTSAPPGTCPGLRGAPRTDGVTYTP